MSAARGQSVLRGGELLRKKSMHADCDKTILLLLLAILFVFLMPWNSGHTGYEWT
jgi:hypothetical protein